MQKFKQYRLLKKVSKLLNTPAPSPKNYDSTMETMYIGATAPRTAGHFADSAVSVRQGQVKRIAELLVEVIDVLQEGDEDQKEDVEAWFVELDVRFQEVEMGLLFTEQEKVERSKGAAGRRKEQTRTVVSGADLEGMRTRVSQWQTEQLERKRRLYKIETTVRDLGVNINDVRCRGLDGDRRAALASLKGSTDSGIRMLREVMTKLGASSRV